MNGFTIFFVAFMVVALVQRLLETFAKRDTVRGKKPENWSLNAMVLLHAVTFVGAFAEFFLMRRSLSPVLWATAIGLCLYVVSVVLRNVAIRALGRFWSLHVEIREQHVLVTDGIYSWVRHPAYLAIWLEIISVPLVGNAFYTSAVMGIVYLIFLLWRISIEEKALAEQLGERYREYQRRVPALIPTRLSASKGASH